MFQNRLAKEKWDALNEAIDAAPVVVPCQNTDPDVWFSDRDINDAYGSAGTTRIAKKLCNMCPVKAQCLEFALVNNELHGIWGGMATKDRQQLRTKARQA
jgi:WhiB family transcriptional regulator, redox-sensing transcriptional regulator